MKIFAAFADKSPTGYMDLQAIGILYTFIIYVNLASLSVTMTEWLWET